MKKAFFFLMAGLMFNTALFAASILATPEAEFDKFMTDYVARLKAVKEEKDDNKAVQMLNSMVTEFRPRAEKLQHAFEQWSLSLSAAERAALEKRMESKPYLAEMLKIAFDPEFGKRIEANLAMKKAMAELRLLTEGKKETGAASLSFSAGPLKGKSIVIDPMLEGVGEAEQVDEFIRVDISGKTLKNEDVSVSFSINGTKPGKYTWSAEDQFFIDVVSGEESYSFNGIKGTIVVESVAGGVLTGSYSGTVEPGDGGQHTPIPVSGTFKLKLNMADNDY